MGVPRTIIFDMDGLIFDTESVYKSAWQNSARELGYLIDDPFWFTLIGIKNEECEHRLQQKFGMDFPIDTFRTRWKSLFEFILRDSGLEYKHGFKELFNYLKSRRYIIGLATSSSRKDIERNFKYKDEINKFDLILSGEETRRGKPDPEIYLKAAEVLNIDTKEILVFEDSINGMSAAINAGCMAIMVPDLLQPNDYIKENAFMILSSLDEAIKKIFENNEVLQIGS